MQECWSQSLVRASYCYFSSSSSLLSSRSFCVDGQSACLSTSRQLQGDRHSLPFPIPTIPACAVHIPYCPRKHLSLVPFCVHQHTAAGRKTRLDIQNYGCNGNLLCDHGVVERNRISSLHSHGKALEKESCLRQHSVALLLLFFIPQVVKIPGVKN